MAKQTRTPHQKQTLPPDVTGAPGGHEAPPPKFGTAKAVDPNGPLPRVVNELERVTPGSGFQRYKVRCDNYTPQKTRYILAQDEDEARAHYLEVNGLNALVAKLKKQAKDKADDVEEPALAVTVLAD